MSQKDKERKLKLTPGAFVFVFKVLESRTTLALFMTLHPGPRAELNKCVLDQLTGHSLKVRLTKLCYPEGSSTKRK